MWTRKKCLWLCNQTIIQICPGWQNKVKPNSMNVLADHPKVLCRWVILIKLFLSLSLPPVFEFMATAWMAMGSGFLVLSTNIIKASLPGHCPLPFRQWPTVCTTNYHKLILMEATAETAMGSGFRRNTVSELKLKNRCTGSTSMGSTQQNIDSE